MYQKKTGLLQWATTCKVKTLRNKQMRNNGNQETEIIRNQKWSFLFSLIASSALYQIGVMYTEYCLNDSHLPISYHFLIGIISSILILILEYSVKNKSIRIKKMLTLLMVTAMVLCALFIPKT